MTLTWIFYLHGMVGIFFPKKALLCCHSRIFYKAFLRNTYRAESLDLGLKHACSEWLLPPNSKTTLNVAHFNVQFIRVC